MSGRSSSSSASSRWYSGASSAAGASSIALDRLERALRERREGPHRLDLDVEELDAHRALGGRAEDVEQAAADRELAAVLDLRDALVAHLDERLRALVEVEQLADGERERVRAKRRVGDLLRQRGAPRRRAPARRSRRRRRARRARRCAGRRGAAAARGATRR